MSSFDTTLHIKAAGYKQWWPLLGGFPFWPWVSTRAVLGPARVHSTGWVGTSQAVMDGVPHCLSRMTPSVCPAGSLGMTLWGEIPAVHSGNILHNMFFMGTFPFLTPQLVFPGIRSHKDDSSNFYLWVSFWENSNWDNKIRMEKQWRCLLEVAWGILDGKSKE